ncbi:UDP-2,3-diacylglucosamine diphosphatase [Gammaproteobacteria bacterium LSUCC0057]|uniref:UDP-2,3-diacylglucosamine hydrolase n=1 Tax=Gammaproteobacteria bacterium LSUCC0057 TaxID=2559237 RepID=A0A4Y8UMV8_9GAMM|nr:UDP-2,3-diacylglucosamine diphosphatase [Gammaproteobacteria bacterium LSUCC0057]
MPRYLISDLHLAPERPELLAALEGFCADKLVSGDQLYILGDLFEAWIGDDDPSPLASNVKALLASLDRRGVRCHVQQGNRDFLLGRRFARDSRCTLLGDYATIDDQHGTILLTHGDLLCTDDVDYQRFRRKSRRPLYRFVLSHLPLRRRQRLASEWRAKSRAANANKASAIMDVNVDTVQAVMAAHGVNRLIHGHTHRPNIHQHGEKTRWVLGDWGDFGWFIVLENGAINLEKFTIKA